MEKLTSASGHQICAPALLQRLIPAAAPDGTGEGRHVPEAERPYPDCKASEAFPAGTLGRSSVELTWAEASSCTQWLVPGCVKCGLSHTRRSSTLERRTTEYPCTHACTDMSVQCCEPAPSRQWGGCTDNDGERPVLDLK